MSRDASFTYLHLHSSHHADMLEDFTRIKLPAETIDVAAHHQPIDPDDEDDVVPDQHAAFGIARAHERDRKAAWMDLGLERLMLNGPPARSGASRDQGVGGLAVGSASVVGSSEAGANAGRVHR